MNAELRKVATNAARINRVRQLVPALLTGRGGLAAIADNMSQLSSTLMSLGVRAGPYAAAALAAVGVVVHTVSMAFTALRAVLVGVIRTLQWLWHTALRVLGVLRGILDNILARVRLLALAAAAAVAAFAYAGTKAVNTYADFEQAIRNAMTVTGLFGEELERAEARMSRFARQVAARSTMTATDVANAFYALASAGMNVNEIMAATPGVIALAEATQSDLRMTTELVTATLRAFRLEASQTNRVVNTFAAAIAASPLNMERLSYSLQYAAPVAAAFGMTVEDTVAALAMLAKAGIYGSIAGTALRGILTREEAPAEKAVRILRRYGLTLRDVSVQQIGFANVLRNLRAAGVRPADVMQIFGLRAGPAMLALLRQGEGEFLRIRQQITGTNFAFRLQQLQLQTIQGQWKILRSQIEEARHSFGEAARGGVMYLLRALQGLVQALRRAGVFRTLGAAFGAMASALATGLQAIAAQAPRIQAVIAALAQNFRALVSGAAQSAPVLIERFGVFLGRLPRYVQIAAQWLKTFAAHAWRTFVTAVGTGIGYVILGLRWLSGALTAAAEWLRTQWPAVAASAVKWFARIARIAVDVAAALEVSFVNALNVVKYMLATVLQPVTDLLRYFLLLGRMLSQIGRSRIADYLPGGRLLRGFSEIFSPQWFAEREQGLERVNRWLTAPIVPDMSWYPRAVRWIETRQQAWTPALQAAGQRVAPALQTAGTTAGRWANQITIVIYANDLGTIGQIAQRTVERATSQQRRYRVR